MKPLNSKNFGATAGKVAAKFYDGSAVVTGYVVKQTGTNKFQLTDGTTTKIVRLAQTASELTALTAGTGDDAALQPDLCTIEVTPHGGGAAKNIARIYSKTLVAIDGTKMQYELGSASAAFGQGNVAQFANSAPTVANAIGDQVGTIADEFEFTFAEDVFADLNMDTLTYTATEDAGALTVFALDAATRTFTKAAGDGTAKAYTIVLTADDGTANVSDTFTITLS